MFQIVHKDQSGSNWVGLNQIVSYGLNCLVGQAGWVKLRPFGQRIKEGQSGSNKITLYKKGKIVSYSFKVSQVRLILTNWVKTGQIRSDMVDWVKRIKGSKRPSWVHLRFQG